MVKARSSIEMATLHLLVFNHQGLIYSTKFNEANRKKSFDARLTLNESVIFGYTAIAFFIKDDKLHRSSVILPLKFDTKKYVKLSPQNTVII